jgi:hypothetical protein
MFRGKSYFVSGVKSSAVTFATLTLLACFPAFGDDTAPKLADQGKNWTEALRKEFYGLDQARESCRFLGSRR